MFIANSVAEREQYLELVDWKAKKECALASVHLLVEYDNRKEPLSFVRMNFGWLAFSCQLTKKLPVDEKFRAYIKKEYDEEEMLKIFKFLDKVSHVRYRYQIISFLNAVQLPDRVIFHELMSESECIDWFLGKNPDEQKRRNEK